MMKQGWTILRICCCLYCVLCVFSLRDCGGDDDDDDDDDESGTGGGGFLLDHSNSSLFVLLLYHRIQVE